MTKPVKSLDLHYPMIKFLIISYTPQAPLTKYVKKKPHPPPPPPKKKRKKIPPPPPPQQKKKKNQSVDVLRNKPSFLYTNKKSKPLLPKPVRNVRKITRC